MLSTLSAMFDNRRDAEAAIAELLQAGIPRGAIHLGIGDPTGADSPLTGNGGSLESLEKIELRGGIGNFLHHLFGTDNSEFAQRIDGAVTHSHLVLTVAAASADIERAAAVVRRYRPVEIESAAPPAAASSISAGAATAAPAPLSQLQAEPPGAHEAAWRSHHADSGGEPAHFDEYAPAYLYGLDMATHEQHGGKEWQEAEADLRGEWERRHPHSGWDKFREAVRHAWERLRGAA